ncbi:MAG: leucyl aminopeptidase [bacterium]
MKIKAVAKDILEYKCDVLIVNLFEGVSKPGGATGAVDKALGGAISRLIKRGEFTGKRCSTAELAGCAALGAGRVVAVGLGTKEKLDVDAVRAVAAASMNKARSMKAKTVGMVLHGTGAGGISPEDSGGAIAEGAILGLYKFDKYKTKKEKDAGKDDGVRELTIVTLDAKGAAAANKGIGTGEIMANAANRARDLVNEPPNVLFPEELARRAKEIAKGKKLTVRVFKKSEIEKMKMGAFLGVAQGGHNPPVFIVMEYKGNPKSDKTMAIVGKGITFDSGGLSLKPANSMEDMKTDMSGAAAVLCAMEAIEALKPKINVTALVPATDNMPGGGAQKVGDIVRAMNGKTVEILNTDAEGRLILCDAICYAVKNKMSPIVDIATLTGACMVALGSVRTGLFGNDKKLIEDIAAAGDRSGERMWHMPTDDDYKELLKSDIADIQNIGGRWGGAITAALFLEYFADKTPWAHLDIAGTAYIDKKDRYFAKGATGMAVRSLTQLALDMAPR